MPAGTRELYAWAAGLFDGEGCFSDKLTLVNTDKSLLTRFSEIFPGGTWKTSGGHGKRKTRYDYIISRLEPLQHAIASMWEWLSERRRAQASVLMIKKRTEKLDARGMLCQKGLHRLEGDNLLIGGRRANGKTFRRCKACLTNWSDKRKIRAD